MLCFFVSGIVSTLDIWDVYERADQACHLWPHDNRRGDCTCCWFVVQEAIHWSRFRSAAYHIAVFLGWIRSAQSHHSTDEHCWCQQNILGIFLATADFLRTPQFLAYNLMVWYSAFSSPTSWSPFRYLTIRELLKMLLCSEWVIFGLWDMFLTTSLAMNNTVHCGSVAL